MRTSGAPNETSMIIVVGVIAVALLVVLAGGPSEFMYTVERGLRSVAISVGGLLHRL